jgi:peptidoglycan L-alanyl-D-glutamate endopeptidase CwlK
MEAAIASSPVDFTIVCGVRSEIEQNKAFNEGYSQLRYPMSRHNTFPSEAVDVCPYAYGKLVWDDDRLWGLLLNHISFHAGRLNVQLEFGAYWKSFTDKPHIELRK